MLLAEASSAICVQRFDGSRNSAIHTTYRISLRSSSLREPRYPLLRVVFGLTAAGRAGTPLFASGGLDWECSCRSASRIAPLWVRKGTRARPAASAAGAFPLLQREVQSVSAHSQAPLGARTVGYEKVHGVDSISSMILPQVHLRKPCYDFSFL